MGFIVSYMREKKTKVAKWREDRRLSKIPRIDANLPIALKLGNIASLSSIFLTLIPEASMLDANSLAPLSSNMEITGYGKIKSGPDTIHRAYLEDVNTGQEYFFQFMTDGKNKLYKDEVYIFMLKANFVPESEEHYDLHLAEGQGVIGNPRIAVDDESGDEDCWIEFDTVWGNPEDWSEPTVLDEKIYDDPKEEAGIRLYHLMNLFSRDLTEDGGEKEFAIISAVHFYDDVAAPNDDYDRIAMLTYVGLKVPAEEISILDVA